MLHARLRLALDVSALVLLAACALPLANEAIQRTTQRTVLFEPVRPRGAAGSPTWSVIADPHLTANVAREHLVLVTVLAAASFLRHVVARRIAMAALVAWAALRAYLILHAVNATGYWQFELALLAAVLLLTVSIARTCARWGGKSGVPANDIEPPQRVGARASDLECLGA